MIISKRKIAGWTNHPFEIPVLMHFVNRYLKKGVEGIFGERFELYHKLDEKLERKKNSDPGYKRI